MLTIFNLRIEAGSWLTIASFLMTIIALTLTEIGSMKIGRKAHILSIFFSFLFVILLSILLFIFCGECIAKLLIVAELVLFAISSLLLIFCRPQIIKLLKISSGKSENKALHNAISSATQRDGYYDPEKVERE